MKKFISITTICLLTTAYNSVSQNIYLIDFPLTKQNIYKENCCITQGITYYTSFNKKMNFFIIHNFPINKLDSLDQFGFRYLKSLNLKFQKTLPEKTITVKQDLVYTINHNRIFFHYHLPTQL